MISKTHLKCFELKNMVVELKNGQIGQRLTKPINRLPFLDQEVKIFSLFQKSCSLY